MSTPFGLISSNYFPKEILYPNPLPTEIDQRRFLIELVSGERVQVIAMSCKLFDALLDGPDKGILIRNLHKASEGIRAAGGKVRSLITLPIRPADRSGYSQREASRIFRQFVETIAADCLRLNMEGQRAALQAMLDKAAEGRRLGHDRDLLNMVLMNFSEKRMHPTWAAG